MGNVKWNMTKMAIEEHLNKIKQGVDAWNKWREDNPNEVPDLSKADIRGCKLQKINLNVKYVVNCLLTSSYICMAMKNVRKNMVQNIRKWS